MRPRSKAFALLVLSSTLFPLAAAAANSDLEAAVKAEAEHKALADPTLTAVAQGTSDQVTLEVTDDKSNVAIKLGSRLGETWLLSLSLKAPFDKDKQEDVTLADLDSLGSGTTASFTLTKEIIQFGQVGKLLDVCRSYNEHQLRALTDERPNWRPIDVDAGQCILDTFKNGDRGEEWVTRAIQAETLAIRDACAEYNEDHPSDRLISRSFAGPDGSVPTGYSGFCDAEALKGRMLGTTTEDRQEAWDKFKSEHLKKHLHKVCSDYNGAPPTAGLIDVDSGDCKYLRLEALGPQWAALGQATSPVDIWFLSLQAEATDKTFKFTDSDTLVRTEKQQENTSIGLSLATLKRGVYYGISYKSQRLFKAAEGVELCRPLDGTDALTCIDTVLGGPKRVDREIGQLDVKFWLTPYVGSNLRLLYDFEAELLEPSLSGLFPRQAGRASERWP